MDIQYPPMDYYNTDKYKGFYKCFTPKNGFSRMIHMAFTNGRETIFTTGLYPEDATAKAFIAIDNYHEQQKKINSIPKEQVTTGKSKKRVVPRKRKFKRELVGAN